MGDCHIRIYVTCDSHHNLLSDELGHFDIQFDIGSYTFNGHSFSNPVFSYVGKDGEQGYLKIFNPSQTATVFSGKMFLALTYDFTAFVSDMMEIYSEYTTDYTKYSAYNMYQKYYVSGGWTNHGYYNC